MVIILKEVLKVAIWTILVIWALSLISAPVTWMNWTGFFMLMAVIFQGCDWLWDKSTKLYSLLTDDV